MTTIEQLFGSKQRIRLLRFFLFHPDRAFSFEEVRRRLGRATLKSRRALTDLVAFNALVEEVQEETGERAYRCNTSWLLYQEFRALFVKAQLLVERNLIQRLEKAGSIRLLVLAGFFVGERGADTDMLIVGRVNHQGVSRLLKAFERDLDQEVNYTIFTNAEYRYRKNVGDRFLYAILERPHLVVLDTTDRSGMKRAAAARRPKRTVAKPRPVSRRISQTKQRPRARR